MARKPTDEPRGRPKGTGILGEQTRLTVRIPTPLYDRLEAFAAGRHFHRGRPLLARCMREALEEYLDRHSHRQPRTQAEASLESPRPRAAARLEAAQDRVTAPMDTATPQEGSDAPDLQTGDEPWSRQTVVALILLWSEEGMTKTAMTARLNAAHVPPLSGKRGWNINKVTSALRAAPHGKKARQAFLARYAPANAAALGREG
jgi:hypothetical protein